MRTAAKSAAASGARTRLRGAAAGLVGPASWIRCARASGQGEQVVDPGTGGHHCRGQAAAAARPARGAATCRSRRPASREHPLLALDQPGRGVVAHVSAARTRSPAPRAFSHPAPAVGTTGPTTASSTGCSTHTLTPPTASTSADVGQVGTTNRIGAGRRLASRSAGGRLGVPCRRWCAVRRGLPGVAAVVSQRSHGGRVISMSGGQGPCDARPPGARCARRRWCRGVVAPPTGRCRLGAPARSPSPVCAVASGGRRRAGCRRPRPGQRTVEPAATHPAHAGDQHEQQRERWPADHVLRGVGDAVVRQVVGRLRLVRARPRRDRSRRAPGRRGPR